MTTEQAIENIETVKKMYVWSTGADEAFDMAKKVLLKQIPKKIVIDGIKSTCPTCGNWCYSINFCTWCGQAIYRSDNQ